MNFDFGEVLTRAWNIVWKHKVLWIFGILASCGRGNGGSGGGGNSGYNGGSNPDQFGYQFEQAGRWLENNLWVIVVIILVLFLIALFFMALGFIGRIGLIKGAYKADKGAESLAFGELWSESLPYFWRVFGLSFLIGLAVMIVMVPLVLLGVLTAGVGFLCILPLICILVPVMVVVGVVVEQANAAIVIEDLSMFDGFKRGWEVTKNNAGPVAIMGLILIIGGGIVGFIFAIPIMVAVFPLIFGAATETTALLWVGVACVCVYLPVLIVLSGVLTAYVQSAWTLTFIRLTAPKPINPETPVIIEADA